MVHRRMEEYHEEGWGEPMSVVADYPFHRALETGLASDADGVDGVSVESDVVGVGDADEQDGRGERREQDDEEGDQDDQDDQGDRDARDVSDGAVARDVSRGDEAQGRSSLRTSDGAHPAGKATHSRKEMHHHMGRDDRDGLRSSVARTGPIDSKGGRGHHREDKTAGKDFHVDNDRTMVLKKRYAHNQGD